MRWVFLLVAGILLMTPSAFAISVTIDHVDGLYATDTVLSSRPLVFHVRFTNSGVGSPILGHTNGFRVFSPNGAIWTPLSMDTASVGWPDRFDLIWESAGFSVDGAGADTVGFGGARLEGPGIEDGFDALVFTIATQVDAGQDGKTLCLDSCFFIPSGWWQWAFGGSIGKLTPEWDGPHCFTIVADSDGDSVPNFADNCPFTYNHSQEDSDDDGVGDSCDVCPHHPEDDCCNPMWSNNAPQVTSAPSISVAPGETFNYTTTAVDSDCDGTELILSIEDAPSWSVINGVVISGRAECNYADTSFLVIASDGDLADTLIVTVAIDLSNQPPSITDSSDERLIHSGVTFMYYPTIDDPDDPVHSIVYLSYPDWCAIQSDTVVGVAPDSMSVETLAVVASDYCNADTLSFMVRVFVCGDTDGSEAVDIDDVVYLINYIFAGGPAPDPLESGDADCSSNVDIDDVVYLISYIFSSGNPPCDVDGNGEPDC